MAKKILILDCETTVVLDVLPEKRLYGEADHFLTYSLDGHELYSVSHDSIRITRLDRELKAQSVGRRWGKWFAVDHILNWFSVTLSLGVESLAVRGC